MHSAQSLPNRLGRQVRRQMSAKQSNQSVVWLGAEQLSHGSLDSSIIEVLLPQCLQLSDVLPGEKLKSLASCSERVIRNLPPCERASLPRGQSRASYRCEYLSPFVKRPNELPRPSRNP